MEERKYFKAGDKFGDYTILKQLSKGGMGAVFLAKLPQSVDLVAIKIMIPPEGEHDDWRKRFAREASLAMRIHHKNLIAVHDVGEDPETGFCYIIMDYIPGGSLSERIRSRGKLNIRESVEITIRIAAALEVAHKAGVVHRDIKPDNILFDSDGTPKLSDLGVAKFSGDEVETTITKSGIIVGTPAYMSPEQMMNSHTVDARSDIYSLGVVLYEMLTGSRPNADSTIVQLLAKAINGEELPDIRSVRPEVSSALAYALSRMVAVKPESRPSSAYEVATLLYDAATGKLIVKKTQREIEAERMRRKKALASIVKWSGIGIAGLTFVALFALAMRGLRRAGYDIDDGTGASVVTNIVQVVVTNEIERIESHVVTNIIEHIETEKVRQIAARASGDLWWENVNVEEISRNGNVRVVKTGDVEWTIEGNAPKSAELNGARDIVIPGGVSRLDHGLFNRNYKFDKVYIPPSVKFMSAAFGNRVIKELHISDISAWCDIKCDTLTGWPIRGADLYLNGKKVEHLVVPGTVREVRSITFMDCKSLKSARFEEGVERINEYAFYGCENITRIELPSTLRQIGNFAFSFCTSLKEIVLSPQNKTFAVTDGILCDAEGTVVFCPNSQTNVKIPQGTKKIGASAFCGNASLVSVTLNDGLEEIQKYAFCGCKNLSEINIPNSVKLIGTEAFAESKITKISLPENVEVVEGRALCRCRGLETVEFPKSLKTLGDDIFASSPLVRKVTFHGNAPELPGMKKSPFAGTKSDLVIEVERGSKGWSKPGSTELPEKWPVGAGADSRRIRYIGEAGNDEPAFVSPECREVPLYSAPVSLRDDLERLRKRYDNRNGTGRLVYGRLEVEDGSVNDVATWAWLNNDGTFSASAIRAARNGLLFLKHGYEPLLVRVDKANAPWKDDVALDLGTVRLEKLAPNRTATLILTPKLPNGIQGGIFTLYLKNDSPCGSDWGTVGRERTSCVIKSIPFKNGERIAIGGCSPAPYIFTIEATGCQAFTSDSVTLTPGTNDLGEYSMLLARTATFAIREYGDKGGHWKRQTVRVDGNTPLKIEGMKDKWGNTYRIHLNAYDADTEDSLSARFSFSPNNFDDMGQMTIAEYERLEQSGHPPKAVSERDSSQIMFHPGHIYRHRNSHWECDLLIAFEAYAMAEAPSPVDSGKAKANANATRSVDDDADIARLLNADERVHTAKERGHEWMYRLDSKGGAILTSGGDTPCISPQPVGKLTVPSRIGRHKVVAIGDSAFINCDKMTDIVLPEGIEGIVGWRSFAHCTKLRSVKIPNSLRFVGGWSFEACTALKNFNFVGCRKANVRNHASEVDFEFFGCVFTHSRSLACKFESLKV